MAVTALIGLALTLIPSILVFMGSISSTLNKQLMAVGTIIWFVAAPFWFRKTRKA